MCSCQAEASLLDDGKLLDLLGARTASPARNFSATKLQLLVRSHPPSYRLKPSPLAFLTVVDYTDVCLLTADQRTVILESCHHGERYQTLVSSSFP